LQLSDNLVQKYLYVVEGVGAVFAAFFLVAYLGGLPTTNVLHSLPEFRLPLTVFGVALLVLVLVGVILAVLRRRS
jgi:hypothetical protein